MKKKVSVIIMVGMPCYGAIAPVSSLPGVFFGHARFLSSLQMSLLYIFFRRGHRYRELLDLFHRLEPKLLVLPHC